MSGFELIAKLRDETNINIPVVIYSGRDLTQDETESLREYTDSIIIKGEYSAERLSNEVSLFLHSVHEKLPTKEKRVIRKNLNKDKEMQNKGSTVLIVDDDMRNSLALSKTLNQKGYKILLARDGTKAIQRLEQNPGTSIVLMDLMMPEMDGYKAIERIRNNHDFKNVPIIILTAKHMKGEKEKSMAAGADDFMTKPIDIDELLQKMNTLLCSN